MQSKVSEWRQKARDGTLTIEEMKEAIRFLRAERMMMPPSKSSSKKTPIDVDALLADVGL